jgi:uncharacterized protein
MLSLELLAGDGDDPDAVCRQMIAERFGVADRGRPGDAWLLETVRKTWRIKLLVRLDLDLKGRCWRPPRPRRSRSSPRT